VDQEGVSELLGRQVAFYEQAAEQYDRKGAPDQLVQAVIDRLRGRVDLSGDLLEIACGAGQWTARFAELSRFVTALDAAPAMLEFARRRLPGAAADRVEFVQADIFRWRPQRPYGAVFFAFWLSHVPPPWFVAFWELVATCLAPGGQVAFVDTGPAEAAFEDDLDASTGVPTARRFISDGSEHRVVKVLHDPDELTRGLADLGWAAHVEPLGQTFFVGWAHRR
jgi:SAM-dependent methyltransferase